MNRCPTTPLVLLTISVLGCLFATAVAAQAPYGVPYGPPLPPAGFARDPGFGPERFSPRQDVASRQQRLGQVRMTQERTDDQYLLIIDLDGVAPENVQVRPMGRTLLVRTRVDARSRRSETYADGSGYRESYRMSSGSSTRRLPVPPDGDLYALERVDTDAQVRILIPRRGAADGR
jgi:HSP20 family molecular chaperone IbpA